MPLTDTDLANLRAGYNSLSVTADALGQQIGKLVADPPPPPPPPPPVVTPPPVSAGPDPLLIYDGSQGLTADGPYGPSGFAGAPGAEPTWMFWKNKGGDWRDADGVAQGNKPFATATFTLGLVGHGQFDVTSFVQPGIEPQMALRGIGTTSVQFQSRESITTPVLVVNYDDDGTWQTIPVMYDVGDDPSSVYSLGNKPSFTVGGKYIGYLRFPASLANKPIRSATLNVPILKVWTAGTIGVFRFAVNQDEPDPYLVTLDNPFFQTEAFEPGSIPAYLEEELFGKDQYKQLSVVTTPVGKALQCRWEPTWNGCVNANILFPDPSGRLGAEVDHVAFSYDLMFLDDYPASLREGGKLFAGFCSATQPDDRAYVTKYGIWPGSCGTPLVGGGAACTGKNGHSLRGLFHTAFPTGHPLEGRIGIGTYAYHRDMLGALNPNGANGENFNWSMYGGGALPTGVWHTISAEGRINTPGVRDGMLRGWINGRLAYRKDDLFLRETPPYDLTAQGVATRLAFRSVYLNQYHGGHALPISKGGIWVRNMRVQVLG